MESTLSALVRLPAGRAQVSFNLPFVLGVASVVGTVALLLIGISTMLMSSELTTYPFQNYRDILPGQHRTNAYKKGFDCDTKNLPIATCAYHSSVGVFSLIRLSIEANYIQSVVFTVASHTQLRVGDLALWWGRPKVARTDYGMLLSWPDYHAVVIPYLNGDKRFSYMLPVHYVTISRSS